MLIAGDSLIVLCAVKFSDLILEVHKGFALSDLILIRFINVSHRLTFVSTPRLFSIQVGLRVLQIIRLSRCTLTP